MAASRVLAVLLATSIALAVPAAALPVTYTSSSNATYVRCTESTIVVARAHSTGLFPRCVINAVAAACCNNQWLGGFNDWGIPSRPHSSHNSHSSADHPSRDGGNWGMHLFTGCDRRPLCHNWKDCPSHEPDEGVMIYRMIKGSFRSWGAAYAKAVAAVQLNCTNSGHTYACRSGSAAAQAVAVARSGFISQATRTAFEQCSSCRLTPKARETLNEALFMQLSANVTATVSARVCVGPNSTASAEGFESCYGQAVARNFAKILAKAMIEGECFDSKLANSVLAAVQRDSKVLCTCNSWVYTNAVGKNAFAQATTSGTCDAYVASTPPSNAAGPP